MNIRPNLRWASLALGFLALTSCATLPHFDKEPIPQPQGQPAWTKIAAGMDVASFASENPPVKAWALRIDLDTEGLQPLVTPGKDNMTTSQTVKNFALQHDCLFAINTAPFDPSSAIEGEARRVVGLTMANDQLISKPVENMAVLLLIRDQGGRLRGDIELQGSRLPQKIPEESIVAACGGFRIVLDQGRGSGSQVSREPRSAAGLSADGKILYLMVADGRRLDSVGLTNKDVGSWLAWLGADRGMTFDGGGSTELVIRDKDGKVQIVNVPIDGGKPGQERAVGSCLGFRLQ